MTTTFTFDHKRVGLAVVRIQPLHLGHLWIINQMISECETAIIGIGSTNKPIDINNPWTFDQRKEMIKNIYGDRIKIIPVADLGTNSTTTEWCDYVLEKIDKLNLPTPTDYFCGSESDGIWYKSHFMTLEEYSAAIENWKSEMASHSRNFVSRDEPEQPKPNFMHIRHRDSNAFVSATEIRTFLRLKSDAWKQWVPRVNHELIQNTFPQELITG